MCIGIGCEFSIRVTLLFHIISNQCCDLNIHSTETSTDFLVVKKAFLIFIESVSGVTLKISIAEQKRAHCTVPGLRIAEQMPPMCKLLERMCFIVASTKIMLAAVSYCAVSYRSLSLPREVNGIQKSPCQNHMAYHVRMYTIPA
jgi:hypothetical protein